MTAQVPLSNNSRPDCLIHMPNGAPPLAIDAKFPLEAYEAIRRADTPRGVQEAAQAWALPGLAQSFWPALATP